MGQQNLKKLRQHQKKLQNEKSQKILMERENLSNFSDEKDAYYQKINLSWYHYLWGFGGVVLGIGLSFLVGYLTLNFAKMSHWQGTVWTAIIYLVAMVVIWWVLGFLKNNHAQRYFNDRRYRYQKTFTISEAKIQLVRKILIISIVPFLIFTVLIACLL